MFTPSDNQQQAQRSMERQLGIRKPKEGFADVSEWEEYFHKLRRRCQAQSQQDPGERRQRREQRLATYYDNHANLSHYARKYIQRYQPSWQALAQALARKCPNQERCQAVVEDVAHLIDDEARALEIACHLQASGKHQQAIRERLMRRRFSSECISKTLQRLQEQHPDQPLESHAVEQSMLSLQRKGLSSNAIVARLASTPAEREQVKDLLGDSQDEDRQAAEKLCHKYHRQGIDARGIQQRLARRGFRHGTITAALAAMHSGED